MPLLCLCISTLKTERDNITLVSNQSGRESLGLYNKVLKIQRRKKGSCATRNGSKHERISECLHCVAISQTIA